MSMHETHSDEQAGTDNGNGRMEAGLRKGIRAFFDLDDITIAFWGSAWTGREIVTVEDRIVSDKRSFRFTTPHHFEHAGIHYKLVFHVASILRGEFRIELYRNGVLVDSDRFRQNNAWIDAETGRYSAWRIVRSLAPFFVLGMAAGAGAAWLVERLTGS